MESPSKAVPIDRFSEFIVPDQDFHTFAISHPDHLKLYASPLADQETHHLGHNHHGHSHSHSSSFSEHGPPVLDSPDPDVPVLKRAHEASTIQLFFDLFFVANLTTFTSLHEVHNWDGGSTLPWRPLNEESALLTSLQTSLRTSATSPSSGLHGCRTPSSMSGSATTRRSSECVSCCSSA